MALNNSSFLFKGNVESGVPCKTVGLCAVSMLRSLFRRRSGKYDFIKSQAKSTGMKVPTTDMTSSFRNMLEKLKRTFSPSKKLSLTADEKFYIALYNEGLLTKNTFDVACTGRGNTGGSILQIKPAQDHPVINVCLGFQNNELASYRRHRTSIPEFQCRTNRVRYGLDRVLLGNTEDEQSVRGIPAEVWLALLEPSFEALVGVKSKRMSNKGPLTKRRCVAVINPVTQRKKNINISFKRRQ